MKIATFNVNSIRKRLPIVLDWLDRHKPDVLCLQETKVQDAEFPLLALTEAGYAVSFRGIKGYNGVAVLSRTKPDAVFYGFDDNGDPDDSRLMRVIVRGIPIINTYVPQGYQIDSPKYAYKLRWFDRLRRYFAKHLSPEQPAIWCGDMNVAPRPIDVHSPEKHLKHVCYHQDARKAYEEAVKWGWQDVFVKLYPERQQYTFWDYRAPSSLEANKGWRIDHILATAPLAATCVRRTWTSRRGARRILRITPFCGRSSPSRTSRIDWLQVLNEQEAIGRRGLAERKKEVDIGLRGAKDSSDRTIVSGEEFGLSRSAMSTQRGGLRQGRRRSSPAPIRHLKPRSRLAA